MMQSKIIEKLNTYKNIAILGFGKEGESTYNFIRRYDKDLKLTILDGREITLNDENATYKKYNNSQEDLEEFDLIIKSPGFIFKDFDKSIWDKVTSQLELLLEFNRKNVIGITGTKGKSTTTTLIYDIFKDQLDNVQLVGNIGIPIFDKIEEFENATIVAEMSSHQLEFVKASPHVGLILNLFVDHLDHTGTLEKYHEAKVNIIRYQDEDDYAIYDADNYYLGLQDFSNIKSSKLTVSNQTRANIYLDGDNIYLNDKVILNKNDIETKLQGDHNLKNIMFALLVANLYHLDLNKALESIKNFQPLEHRLEFFGKYEDINFYDDAIATIPEATINGCKTLKNVDTLIFGGMDRNIDYEPLITYLNDCSINHFICMPETGYKLADYLDPNKVIKAETLEDAVNIAFEVTEKDKICLLSPAASSYNCFKNFEEKGNKFKELVKGHVQKHVL